MTSQLSALDGTDNFNYLMALQDICSRIDSDSDSRRNSVAANSIFFPPFFSFFMIRKFQKYFFQKKIRLIAKQQISLVVSLWRSPLIFV